MNRSLTWNSKKTSFLGGFIEPSKNSNQYEVLVF